MIRGASRDAQIWQALRAARSRPAASDPIAAVGSLVEAQDTFLAQLRTTAVGYEVRTHGPVRHARHLASTWGLALDETVRATLFDADGERILVAVPADRKIEAPRLRSLLGAETLVVLRADRGVGRFGWVNLPGDPGPLPGLPSPFGARLIVDPEVLIPRSIVVPLAPTLSIRVGPREYVLTLGGEVFECVGRTRLLPEGGATDSPPTRSL
jgi:hypothetical protein